MPHGTISTSVTSGPPEKEQSGAIEVACHGVVGPVTRRA